MWGFNEPTSVASGIATVPIFFWELSLGLYLVVKGFKPSPTTAGMVIVSTLPANRDVDA